MAAAGCTKQQPPPPPPAAKTPEVVVTLPSTAEITDYEDFTGRTVATKTVEVRARVTGYLQKINFKEGGLVQQGTVLFEIDPRSYQAEVDRNAANLVQANARYKRLNLDYLRSSRLIASKSISQEQFDQISGDRLQSLAAIDVTKAELALAKLNLSYTKVVSPISGRISRTMLDPGNLVRADETVLTTIVATDPIYAYFDVDERTLLRVRRFTDEGRIRTAADHSVPVMIGLADEPGYTHQGSVNFVDNRLDANTGTLQLRGVLPNKQGVLSPGLFVRVRLPIGQPYSALLLREQAIGTDQGQKFVYVVTPQSKAEYRQIEVGKLHNGQRVVLKGLAAGERVVVSGLQRVRPGAEVSAKLEASTAQAQSSLAPDVAQASLPQPLPKQSN